MTRIKTLLLVLLLQLIFLSSCARYAAYESTPGSCYLNPVKDLKKIGKTALVELTNNSVVHQVSPDVTEAIFQEIQKKQIFGLTKIRQDNPVWRSLQLDMDSSYKLEELAQIRKILKCDAILTGTIMEFDPYPHMALGLRLRLIDLSDGQLLWALEQVWDTTDKTTQDRIKAYYSPKDIIFGDENLSGQLGSVSSLKFFKFVAHEIAETLQSGS
jgi:hypothetical protein